MDHKDNQEAKDANNDKGDNQLLQEAYTYLVEKYPDGCKECRKRMIRKKALKFEIKDGGELCYKFKKGKVHVRSVNSQNFA